MSLTDSRPGDELLLVNYEHHPVSSPYHMRFAIFVRRGEETYRAVDEVPEQLRLRTLAVRAFDADAMMVGFELAAGRDLEAAIDRLFESPCRLSACPFRCTGLLCRKGRPGLSQPASAGVGVARAAHSRQSWAI